MPRPGRGANRVGLGPTGVVGWCYIVTLLGARLVQEIGTPTRGVAVVQAILPWQLLLAPVVGLALIARHRWRTLVVLVFGVAAFAPLVVAWQFHGDRVTQGARPAVRVVSSNVLYDNSNLAAAFDDIARIDADIVVLSEITDVGRKTLEQHRLRSQYPFATGDPYGIGVVVLSRFAFVESSAWDWVSGESQALTLEVGGETVRLIASHPPPPLFNTQAWNAELVTIARDVESVDVPTIVAGDLNGGWVLPPFRSMLRVGRLTDALAAAGLPWTFTWPNESFPRRPFVTLDHILVNDLVGVVDAGVVDVVGSDHRAVTATIIVKQRR